VILPEVLVWLKDRHLLQSVRPADRLCRNS
jgi:hypothetical protein